MLERQSQGYLSLRNVTKSFDGVPAVVGLNLDVEKGKLICLLGPSGCGKTTTLRLIAGFEAVDEGSMCINGKDVTRQRPYDRNVGLLFQDYALFPHMTVADNVSYGMRRRKFSSTRLHGQLKAMLELVKLEAFSQRMPHELSGGERQRVALARALAISPDIMLLDEPLSALDAKLRHELRIELKEIIRRIGITTLLVTHDQDEAMGMAEEIAVMNKGRIEQQGSPSEIYLSPTTKFVATFIGQSNWFTGRVVAADSGSARILTSEGIELQMATGATLSPAECEFYVRPERIRMSGVREASSIQATVMEVASMGSEIHYWVKVSSGRRIAVVEQNSGSVRFQRDETVSLRISPEDLIHIPPIEK